MRARRLRVAAPVAPYRGNARLKTGDPTRRYVPNSVFRTHPTLANTPLRFRKVGNRHMHLAVWDTPVGSGGLLVLDRSRISATNGVAITADLSVLVPPHCRIAEVHGRTILGSAYTDVWLRHVDIGGRQRSLGSVTPNATTSFFALPRRDRLDPEGGAVSVAGRLCRRDTRLRRVRGGLTP